MANIVDKCDSWFSDLQGWPCVLLSNAKILSDSMGFMIVLLFSFFAET